MVLSFLLAPDGEKPRVSATDSKEQSPRADVSRSETRDERSAFTFPQVQESFFFGSDGEFLRVSLRETPSNPQGCQVQDFLRPKARQSAPVKQQYPTLRGQVSQRRWGTKLSLDEGDPSTKTRMLHVG